MLPFKKTHLLLASTISLLSGAGNPLLANINFEISGFQTQITGTTTDIPKTFDPESTSGSAKFYNPNTEVGDFAVFDMIAVDDINETSSDFADLRVTYTADNGGVGSDIMIARTTNSQGLTDDGTLSIFIDVSKDTGRSARLTFDWFTPGSFIDGVEQPDDSSLLTTPINYTTFDIDFKQLVRVQSSEIASYTLESDTKLTATDDGSSITFEDDNASSTFVDPTTAAQFLTRNAIASHNVDVGNQDGSGPALFMFEFRDPSDIVTLVPEPSAVALILGLVGVGFAGFRRRR